MQIVSALLLCEQGVSGQKHTCYFILSLQARYLKSADRIGIHIGTEYFIIYANFKNDRTKDNGYIRCTKMEKKVLKISKKNFSMYCIVLQYNIQIGTI